jgi:hypothetical protein
MSSGWGGWAKAGQQVPAGRLLVVDESRVLGFGRSQYDTPGAHVGVDADGVWGPIKRDQSRWTFYRLFGQKARDGKYADNKPNWTQRIPLIVRAMVLGGDTLFVAGPSVSVERIPHKPEDADPLADALTTDRGGMLLAVSPDDGETLAQYELAGAPVFDGMAAAHASLYISTKNGEVVCMTPK